MNLARYGRLRAAEIEWHRGCVSDYSQVYVPRPVGKRFAQAVFAAMAFAFFCALSACGGVSILDTALRYVAAFVGWSV